MTTPLDKAIHKFAKAFDLVLDFHIELSDDEVLRDLSFGRDEKRTPIGTGRVAKELS